MCSLKLAATYNPVPWLAKRECRSYLCCLTCKLLEEIVTLPLLKFALPPIPRLGSFSVVALLTWDIAAVAFVPPKAGRNLQPRAVAGEQGMQIISCCSCCA